MWIKHHGTVGRRPRWSVVLVDLLARERAMVTDWVGLGSGHAKVVAAACGSKEIRGRPI
jgi:hypothetical protein